MSNGEKQEQKTISGFIITDEAQARIDALRKINPQITDEEALKKIIQIDRRSDDQERQKGAP